MPFPKPRPIPLITASAISLTIYAINTRLTPLYNESPKTSTVKPFATAAWGSNNNLLLSPNPTVGLIKKPTPLPHLQGPWRDLVLAESYGAAVDVNGDCWLWGTGYCKDGKPGRGLRGKNIKTLASAPAKVYALSHSGSLYVFSSSKAIHSNFEEPRSSWFSWMVSSNPGVDHVELKAQGGLKWGERWEQVSVGKDHLLALTNKGRIFSTPVSEKGNSHRQLGTRQELLPFPSPSESKLGSKALAPEKDIRYCSTLTPIPSLANIPISQICTSSRTSFALTRPRSIGEPHHVLAWGDNSQGQVGLGTSSAVDTVPVPVEVVFSKSYLTGTKVDPIAINAGGNTTFYTVIHSPPFPRHGSFIDVLSCGSGLQGSLGTGSYTSATCLPVKVKALSGLVEYDEKAKDFRPIGVKQMSVSKSITPHVFAILDTLAPGVGQGGEAGRDVLAWGSNVSYQIGTQKRSSTPTPIHLPRLGTKLPEIDRDANGLEFSATPQLPLPQDRLTLSIGRADACDPTGKVLKKGVKCEEVIVAGPGCSILFNKAI
ncbi:hypothetical protein L204_106417 [Cryptococcus depauperatus]|nr:hypothetical protein L204_06192 [Cryptococcus depauperatus CBS 7855]